MTAVQSEPESGDEPQRLQEEMPGHASFWRNTQLSAIKRHVFPRLFGKNRSLRIWVPGTATGEDAYGLAIAIHEYAAERGESPPAFKIFGTDPSERAIAQARSGCFSRSVARDLAPERFETYFVRDGDGCRIRPDLRSSCVFATHDLTRDPLLTGMDLVSCRRVLGCLTAQTAKRIAAGFNRTLREGGFLLLGPGEGFELSGFESVDELAGIFECVAPARAGVGFGFGPPGSLAARSQRATQKRDRHASSARLQASSRYAESIVDSIRQGVVVLGSGLRVRSANRAFLSLFALDCERIGGRPLDRLGVDALCRPRLLEALRKLGPGEGFEAHRLPHAIGAAGGEFRSFVANARRMDHADFTLLTLEDVTAAEEARAEVRRAEHDFRRILHDADEAIVLADSFGQPFFANRAAAELFGYAPEEMFACSLQRLLPDLDLEPDAAARARASNGDVRRNVTGRRKDGSEFPARVIVTSTARDRRPVTVVFVSDVTRERAAEYERRAFQEQLERMAFDAALTEERERRRIALDLHDRLGQSLALAQLKLASARDDVPGELKAAVKTAVGLVEQAVSEVRTLMFELSPPVLYELGLRDAISWLVEDMEKRYGLHVDVTDEGIPQRLDDVASGVVFRAARELLMNVVKHAGTSVAKVSLSCKDERLVVEVRDEGAGFAEVVARTGGFGLFSVRQQISRLAGLLEVESVLGQGTCATIRVPLSPPELAGG